MTDQPTPTETDEKAAYECVDIGALNNARNQQAEVWRRVVATRAAARAEGKEKYLFFVAMIRATMKRHGVECRDGFEWSDLNKGLAALRARLDATC